MTIEKVISTCNKYIYIEIYNMIFFGYYLGKWAGYRTGITKSHIRTRTRFFFSFFKPVLDLYPLGFRYTRPVCFGFRVYPSGLSFFAIPRYGCVGNKG
ncbi:hypothetical protein Hanom_Chr11g00979821 [Helianthus anomalus]